MNKAKLNEKNGGDSDQPRPDAGELCRQGSAALEAGKFASAYRQLRSALDQDRSPNHLSLFALALARYTGDAKAGIALCQEAIRSEPKNPDHFLRLGTVYLTAGRKKEAVRIFNLGLRVGRQHPGITRALQSLGQREEPVLPFLARSHPLNRYLGKMRSRYFRKNG